VGKHHLIRTQIIGELGVVLGASKAPLVILSKVVNRGRDEPVEFEKWPVEFETSGKSPFVAEDSIKQEIKMM
jgi:hypothetical protein